MLLFMHAVLDDVLFQCCVASVRAAPLEWQSHVLNRKVALAEVQETDFQRLLESQLAKLLEALERESLLKKADSLLGILKPQPCELVGETHAYDRSRLESLDELRHSIVHRKGPQQIPTLNDDLSYLEFVLFTLLVKTGLHHPGTFDSSALAETAQEELGAT